MSQQINKLQKKIMRRIYYAFALKVGTHPIVIQVALLVTCAYALIALVSVRSIINNFLSIQVGGVGNYVLHTFVHAGPITLIVVGVMCVTLVSLQWNLRSLKFGRRLQAI